ncbi:MAG: TetR/AcrR family transcriptional regulator [Myxococcales bacterium]|nr:TetR/AcrR family transcriptional regulator [Myxococcales bacterium]
MVKRRLPAAERRRQIAQAALEILATRGAAALKTAELARVVGTSDAALFRHFPDKAAILDEATKLFEATLMKDFPPTGPEPLERLRAFFLQRLALCEEHPHILRLAFDDRILSTLGDEGRRRVQGSVARSLEFVTENVRACQARGLTPAVDPEVVVWMVTGVVRGAIARATSPSGGTVDAEALWRDVERVIAPGR